ncbi:MAG: hypothetical protein K2N73_11110 [Lachnospiraceae bacterium]|nr:hypothetical protein [Lachnospiraceae bacterium]
MKTQANSDAPNEMELMKENLRLRKELILHSIVHPKRPGTKPGRPHKIFENKLKQDFTAEEINKK